MHSSLNHSYIEPGCLQSGVPPYVGGWRGMAFWDSYSPLRPQTGILHSGPKETCISGWSPTLTLNSLASGWTWILLMVLPEVFFMPRPLRVNAVGNKYLLWRWHMLNALNVYCWRKSSGRKVTSSHHKWAGHTETGWHLLEKEWKCLHDAFGLSWEMWVRFAHSHVVICPPFVSIFFSFYSIAKANDHCITHEDESGEICIIIC